MIRIKQFIGRDMKHSFPVRQDLTLTADTVPDLIDKIAEYRLQNGLPVGDPSIDLTAYYAMHHPFAVENGERIDAPPVGELPKRVYAWTNGLWRNPPKNPPSTEEAPARASACVSCPFRREVGSDGSPAFKEAQRRVYLLSRGLLWLNEVGWCEFHGWDNRLAVLLRHEADEKIACPKECWLDKSENKSTL